MSEYFDEWDFFAIPVCCGQPVICDLCGHHACLCQSHGLASLLVCESCIRAFCAVPKVEPRVYVNWRSEGF